MKFGGFLASLFTISPPGPDPVSIDEVMQASDQTVLAWMECNKASFSETKHNLKVARMHYSHGTFEYLCTVPGFYDRPIDLEGKTMQQLFCDSEYVEKSGAFIDEWCKKQREPKPSYLEELWDDWYSYFYCLLGKVFWPNSNYVTIDEMMQGTNEEFMGWMKSLNGKSIIFTPNDKVLQCLVIDNKDYVRSAVDSTYGRDIDTEGKSFEQIWCESKYVSKSGDGIDEWCSQYEESEQPADDWYSYLTSYMPQFPLIPYYCPSCKDWWTNGKTSPETSPETSPKKRVTVDEMMQGTSEEFMGWVDCNDGTFMKFTPNRKVLRMPTQENQSYLSVVESSYEHIIDFECKGLFDLSCDLCYESKYISKNGTGIDEWCRKYEKNEGMQYLMYDP